jgi:cyclohexa-1,5-dienecarbonyl-CoA hydratase
MTESKYIKLEKADGVARITFDRPKHNVFNIEMMRTFNNVLKGLVSEGDLKCVVLLGEGRSWCAGVDVGDHKPEMVDEMIATFDESFGYLHALAVPTIAAVQGSCLGGGMEYAIACDIIIASENAAFGQPEVRLGFLPPYAAVRLPQLVGSAKAIEICTTGNIYSAAQAQQMGFVSRVVPADDFSDEVEKCIKHISASSPLILRLNKKAVKSHLGMPIDSALPSVNNLFLNTLMKTEDTLEGIASFYEKRKPVWKNR